MGCGCKASLNVRYPKGVDYTQSDDFLVFLDYRTEHNDRCIERIKYGTLLLSNNARERLENIIRLNENIDTTSIIDCYQAPFVRDAMAKYCLTKEEVLELWERNWELMPRDAAVTPKDVENCKRRLQNNEFTFHVNDALSVRIWATGSSEAIFYQEQRSTTPFILIISTDRMLKQFAEFGHNRPLLMDATFGTNKWKFSLTTLMVCML